MSLIDLRDAVTNAITANTAYTAENGLVPVFKLSESKDLRIVTVPRFVESQERLTRGNFWEELPQVQVGVVQRVQPGTVESEDILAIAEEVRDYFKANANIQGVENRYTVITVLYEPFYDYEELDDSNRIVSVIGLRCKEFSF